MKGKLLPCILACLLLAGCFQSRNSFVRVCHPTKKLIREAATKYADHTPLTADGLRHMLMDDTTHYKIVVVYSYCCGSCREGMNTIFAPMMRSLDTSRCRMYFVLDDCGSLPWNADYLDAYGITTRYYMRDTDSLFLWWRNGKRTEMQDWTNIANYVFQPRRAFTDCGGVPCTFIVSPDGRVKQVFEQFNDYGRVTALDLRNVKQSIYDLDFDKVDTVCYSFGFGIDDIEPADTVTFRTYRPRPKVCTPDGVCR